MAGLKKATNVSDELTKVSESVEAEELRHLNPDTPVLDEEGVVRDVPLLAGYIDEEGVLHNTFSYREMTGRDEEAINKADVRSNGAKLTDVLCERCVVSIGTLDKKTVGVTQWAKIIRSMIGYDIDYMSFKIRELSKGHEIQFTHVCPNCGQKLVTVVDTEEFNIIPFKGLREVPFTLPRGYRDRFGNFHKDGVIRLPNGYDREAVTPLFKKNSSTATTALLARLITFNDGTVVSQNLVNEMALRDRAILEKILKENVFGVDTTIEGITCDSCGRDLSGVVGESDFF